MHIFQCCLAQEDQSQLLAERMIMAFKQPAAACCSHCHNLLLTEVISIMFAWEVQLRIRASASLLLLECLMMRCSDVLEADSLVLADDQWQRHQCELACCFHCSLQRHCGKHSRPIWMSLILPACSR